VKGRAEPVDEGKPRLLVSEILPLEEAKLQDARQVTIRFALGVWDRRRGERLRDILNSHRGDCPVTLEILSPGSFVATVVPSSLYRVRPDTTFKKEIELLLGSDALVLARSGTLAVKEI
jgi:hypothetical protein